MTDHDLISTAQATLGGITQAALARRIGVSQRTIAAWSRGEGRIPGPAKIVLRMWATGMPVLELADEDIDETAAA